MYVKKFFYLEEDHKLYTIANHFFLFFFFKASLN